MFERPTMDLSLKQSLLDAESKTFSVTDENNIQGFLIFLLGGFLLEMSKFSSLLQLDFRRIGANEMHAIFRAQSDYTATLCSS